MNKLLRLSNWGATQSLLTTAARMFATYAIVAFSLSLAGSTSHAQIHNDKPLELSGYSLSEAYDIEDDSPLDLDDPVILRLLYRIKKTSPKSRNDYLKYSKDVTWEQLSSETQDYRLWVFDRHVRLKKITKHRFASAEEDDEVKGVFVCHCENEQQQPLIVLSASVPRSLPKDVSLDEPIKLTGFLFARRAIPQEDGEDQAADETQRQSNAGDPAEDQPSQPNGIPLFIVDRIAWYPKEVTKDRSNKSQVILAQNGVDVGLLDLVRENNATKLGDGDREAFFQMLAGINRFDAPPKFDEPIGFLDMMRDTKSNFGNATRIKGMVRTCSEINITNPDTINRIGVSKYYQLMLFPDLDGGKIVIKNKKKDGEDIEFRRFPITICCLELPQGLIPETVERKPFLVDGFFFRLWKFQSDKTDAVDGISGQLSPLIIAKSVTQIDSQEGLLNSVLLYFVVAVMAGIAILFWWYRTADRRHQTPGQKIIETLPEQIDVSGIESSVE